MLGDANDTISMTTIYKTSHKLKILNFSKKIMHVAGLCRVLRGEDLVRQRGTAAASQQLWKREPGPGFFPAIH